MAPGTVLLACAVLAAACTPAPGGGPSLDGPGRPATVLEVVDGDTLVLEEPGRTEVRLLAINAPEAGECGSGAAAAELASIAGPGTRIRVLEYGTDRFGRTLAVVTTGAGSANEAMVAAGLALSMAGSGTLTERLREAEDAARTAHRGLWDPATCGSDEPPRIVIGDLVADPAGPDGEPGSDEVVVVTNREERTVDLTGWVLRDESSTHRFPFPPGTTLAPGSSLEVRSGCEDGPGVLGWCGGAVWNNGGDTAFLLDDRGAIVDWRRSDG